MTWTGRRVLVTGAGGFIGSHLAERLVREGARVRAFLHYNALGHAGWLEDSPMRGEMEPRFGDIADRDVVREAVRGVDVVFHLAALIGIPYSYDAPLAYVRTNVEGTLNVLQAAREFGVERVVQTSTSEVYGTARFAPITEEHPLQGQSPYSASKIGADKLAESFHLSFGVPVVIARPFNTFGPRQSARAIIPTVITQCLRDRVVRVGNTTPLRDFNYVDNTVAAFLAAARSPRAVGETVHFGSGREIAVADVIRLIARLVDRDVEVRVEDARVRPRGSEVERLLADNTRAGGLLDWAPAVALEDGLARTIAWFRENLDRYRRSDYVV